MLRKLGVLVVISVALTGCARVSESKLNPLNWFDRAPEATAGETVQRKPLVPAQAEVTIVDARVLIETLTSASLEPSGNGAILRATGIAARQGYFNAELVLVDITTASQGFFNAELVLVDITNGVLTYEFRVERPTGYEAIGSAASRQITVATVIDAAALRGVRGVVVRGSNGSKRLSR